MRRKLILFYLLLLIQLPGCATYIFLDPVVQIYDDPDLNYSQYKRFTIHPLAGSEAAKELNPLLEKQILSIVKEEMEQKGFEYTEDKEKADFVLIMQLSNEFKETYVPPQTTLYPVFSSGHVGGEYFSSSTLVPTTQPGYFRGYYYPTISINFIDAASFKDNQVKLIWSAVGANVTSLSDIRYYAPDIIYGIVDRLPFHKPSRKSGVHGIHMIPTNGQGAKIEKIDLMTPASKAGLMLGDVIIEINQKPIKEVWEAKLLLRKIGSGEAVNLKVQRSLVGIKSFEFALE